jgi:hypothetical protein
MFPVANYLERYALSPLLSNFVSNYAIKKVKENKKGLKLNGPCQLWQTLMMLA